MTQLRDLIDAYEERLTSYQFLLKKVELELVNSRDEEFIDFCECEGKRLQDLIQLCQQVLNDLHDLAANKAVDGETLQALEGPQSKPPK
ncbi:MAG: hypothetical protein R3332_00785 [Pseudohongiellaceae bacterium]|nr:hypothetical protein [Pseudohongiellaceae bacterium]